MNEGIFLAGQWQDRPMASRGGGMIREIQGSSSEKADHSWCSCPSGQEGESSQVSRVYNGKDTTHTEKIGGTIIAYRMNKHLKDCKPARTLGELRG